MVTASITHAGQGMFADLNRDEIQFHSKTPDTMSHRKIMLTPNNSLAPNLLYSLFSAMVFLPGI